MFCPAPKVHNLIDKIISYTYFKLKIDIKLFT